jgi:hypothetical protein
MSSNIALFRVVWVFNHEEPRNWIFLMLKELLNNLGWTKGDNIKMHAREVIVKRMVLAQYGIKWQMLLCLSGT